MSKRSKVKSLHTSLRLAPDISERIAYGANATGWSSARVVGHMLRLGFAAAKNDRDTVEGLVRLLDGAIVVHKVEAENARRLAAAKAELRAPAKGRGSRPGTTKDAKAARRPAVPKLPPASAGSAA